MPIPTSALEQTVLAYIFTPRTPFEELYALFQEQADPHAAYAVVRVGTDAYTVLRLADLEQVQTDRGQAVRPLALGNIPELRLHELATEPVRYDTIDEQEARDHVAQLPTAAQRPLVVLDPVGTIMGVLPATPRVVTTGPPLPVLTLGGDLGRSVHSKPLPPTQPYLNTRFDGVEHNEPLKIGRRVPLIVSVGAPTASSRAQSSRPFTFPFADEQRPVAFTVHVDADPEAWHIRPIEPTLIVAPPGVTNQEAEFLVTAKQPGRDKFHISLERQETGATVQHIWLPVWAAEDHNLTLPRPLLTERVITSLPLETTSTNRRCIELTITSAVKGFDAVVRADLPTGTVRATYHIPISSAEIQNATRRIRQELERVVFYRTQKGRRDFYPFADAKTVTVDKTIARQALVPLADVGQQYWNLLFHGARAPDGLRQLAQDIRDLPHGSTVQVVIEDTQFIIPWALLYDKPGPITAETLDWSGFWGYRYILDVLPPGRYPAPAIDAMPPTIQVCFNDDDSLRPFTQPQEAFVRKQLGAAETTVAWGKQAIEERFSTPNNAAIIYFYCHGKQMSGAVQVGALASESALAFSGDHETRLADLRRLPPAPFGLQPLIFLNACEGATQDAFFYESFMTFFVEELGARGFIGTEVKAPQKLAHDLALQFFDGFAHGATIGDILWKLRRHYLDEHHNILAFNYSVYCLNEVRLATPLRT